MSRYVIRELTGFHTLDTTKASTDIMVLDTLYAYAVVAYYPGSVGARGQRATNLDKRRARAAAFVAAKESDGCVA